MNNVLDGHVFDDPIYLEVDMAATMKKFKKFIKEFNDDLRLNKPSGYLTDIIKNPVVETAKFINKCFARVCCEQKKTNASDPLPLALSNGLISKEKTDIAKKTAYNHLLRLQHESIAFIVNKKFRGRTNPYYLRINEKFIVYKKSHRLNQFFIDVVKNQNNGQISANELLKILSITPTGEDFSNEGIITFLHHKRIIELLKNLNINIKSGKIGKSQFQMSQDEAKNLKASIEISEGFSNFDLKYLKELEKGTQVPQKTEQKETPSCAGPLVNNFVNQLSITENYFINACWNFSEITFGWHGAAQTPEFLNQKKQAIAHIYDYLTLRKNGTRTDSPDTITERYNNFVTRLMLVKAFVDRDPLTRFYPRLYNHIGNYFHPENQKGFAGTLAWLTSFKKKREQNKLYSEGFSNYTKCVSAFSQNPKDTILYTSLKQRLRNTKNANWLQQFEQFVIDFTNAAPVDFKKTDFTITYLQQMRVKTMYQAFS